MAFWSRSDPFADLEKQKIRLHAIKLAVTDADTIHDDEKKRKHEEKISKYDYMVNTINAEIDHIESLSEKIESGTLDQITQVRFRNNIRILMKALIEDVKKLNDVYMKKRDTDDHVRIDGEMQIKAIQRRINLIKGGKRDRNDSINLDNVKLAIPSYSLQSFTGPEIDDDDHGDLRGLHENGSGVVPIGRSMIRQEAMTSEHQEQLQLIHAQTDEQNQILGEMDTVLSDILEMAERMGDELDLQNKMLENMDDKTEKVQGKLDKVNERMDDIKRKNTRPICCYLLCFLILGIITFTLVKMLFKI
jgi:t-SNARE complex subunit (syntaxin)